MPFKRALLILLSLILLPVYPSASAESAYYIEVDCYNNIVTVYSTADNSIVRQMICSTGVSKWPSPHGTFTMPALRKSDEREEWYRFEDGYGKYGSRIKGNYLFHSYLFYTPNDNDVKWESIAALGTDASHGCIRLKIEDAKWICYNCFPGTKVKIYDEKVRYDYLKELLYEETYTTDSGLTYAEWISLAVNEGDLGYSSTGDEVKSLQERMIELGLFSGEADGRYDEFMVKSVKAVQNVLGLPVTGVTNAELRELLFSDSAPVSISATLSTGMSGPSVKVLQILLSQLGLYNGAISGEFDGETETAVKLFQSLCGYPETGVAAGTLQSDMISALSKLEQQYGAGNFAVYFEDETLMYGTVKSSTRLNVRESMSTDSEIIAKIPTGSRIPVASREGGWLKLVYGDRVGYVNAEFVDVETETVKKPKYAEASASRPAITAVFDDSVTVIGAKVVTYALTNTKERLYVRESTSTSSEIAFMLMPQTRVKVISYNDTWAYISYGGKTGFTRKSLLEAFQVVELTTVATRFGSSGDDIAALADDDSGDTYALVIAEDGTPLMSYASSGAETLATLNAGARMKLLLAGESWAQVSDGEYTGYVRSADIMTGTNSELTEYEDSVNVRLAVVNTGSEAELNMRSAPSVDAEVLGTLENGTVVEIRAGEGEWCEVTLGMKRGYVMAAYLEDFDKTTENDANGDGEDGI